MKNGRRMCHKKARQPANNPIIQSGGTRGATSLHHNLPLTFTHLDSLLVGVKNDPQKSNRIKVDKGKTFQNINNPIIQKSIYPNRSHRATHLKRQKI
jgi:hypothetical protein